MKVIFLDIDGVLNGHQWIHLEEGPRIIPTPARIFNKIVGRTQAKIVVSSTWSRKVKSGDLTPSGFAWMLKTHGVFCEVIDAINSDVTVPKQRADNIMKWVRENKPEKWLCIDGLPVPVQFHIRPNPATGLTSVDIQTSLRILA